MLSYSERLKTVNNISKALSFIYFSPMLSYFHPYDPHLHPPSEGSFNGFICFIHAFNQVQSFYWFSTAPYIKSISSWAAQFTKSSVSSDCVWVSYGRVWMCLYRIHKLHECRVGRERQTKVTLTFLYKIHSLSMFVKWSNKSITSLNHYERNAIPLPSELTSLMSSSLLSVVVPSHLFIV